MNTATAAIPTIPQLPGASGAPRIANAVAATATLAALGMFVTYLPINSISTSLTNIAQSTGATTTELQWVTLAYVIPMAAAVLSAGVLGDMFGRRRMFTIGLTLTGLGALIASAAGLLQAAALPVLWAGQAVSGLGGGILMPTTLALIAHAVPDPRQRGKYIAMWAAGTTAGLALGPISAGLILEVANWGWVFVPTVVVAAITAVIAHFHLPESSSPEGRSLDLPGQITASIAIAASIWGVVSAGSSGWGSPQALTGIAIGLLAAIAFVVRELRTPKPLMNMRLFRSPAFSASTFAAMLAMFSIVGSMFLLSLYLGSVQQLSALEIGVRIVFIPGVAALSSPLVGRLLARFAALTVLIVGLVIAAAGLALIGLVTAETSFIDLVWRLAVFGVANAFMLTSLSAVAVNSVPVQLAGMAGATNTALRQFGGALGPAILGSIYLTKMQSNAGPEAAFTFALLFSAALVGLSAVICVAAAIFGRRVSVAL